MRRALGLVLVAVFLVATGGCRKIQEKMAEKAVEKATGGQADIDSKTGQVKLRQKGPDGKETEVQVGDKTTVPADFPKNVPVYPGGKLIAAVSISQGEQGHMVTLTTSDSVSAVTDWYKKNLTGFKIDGELNANDTTILTMSNAELTVSVTAAHDASDNLTTVQLTASKKTPS